MSLLNLVNNAFPNISSEILMNEKFRSLDISYATTLNSVSIENLETLFASISDRDSFRLSIIIDSRDPISIIDSNTYSISEFHQNIQNENQYLEGEEQIILKFLLNKNIVNNILSVYSLESFSKFWQENNSFQLLKIFSEYNLLSNWTHFKLIHDNSYFNTEYIYFSNDEITVQKNNDKNLILNIKNNCHFENFINFPFTSKHFHVVNKVNENTTIVDYLQKLSFIFCLCGLYDVTSIDSESVFYAKINGYKTLNFEIPTGSIDISSLNEYKKIYDWVYSDNSNVSDKIGLARNILTIYLTNDKYIINESVFNSIKSGHKTYLQQNISKYIEIRNKLNDQLDSISKTVSDLSDKYLSNYQKSNFAFISFFISIFIIRVLSTNQFNNIFTKDATIIFFSLIGISVIYLIFSFLILNSDLKRLEQKYRQLKSRFKDLLVEEDINNILRNDNEYNSEISFLKKRRKTYTWLWVLTIIIFLLLILTLSSYINWDFILSFFKYSSNLKTK